MPDSASGDDLNAPRVAEGGDAPGRVAAAPAPWGDSRPWWSADSGGGTGPQAMPAHANGSGAHPIAGGTGPHGVIPEGTGPHGVVHGVTGPHGVVHGGTGPHGVIPDGTGPHGALADGTGPIRTLPREAPGGAKSAGKRFRKLVLIAGAAAVAAGVLVVGALAFRQGGGSGGAADRSASTSGVSKSTRVIEAGGAAGGLAKDPLTPPQASAAYPFVAGAIKAAGIPVAERGQAVYGDQTARQVNVLFMGGTGPVGDPETFLQKVQPTTFIAGQDADPGNKGGKAVCGTFAVLSETHTFCAWATEDSYGVVASNRATLNPQFPLIADVMRRIRDDVERPRS
ncbi:MAG: hypothetical protein FWJ90_04465 [Actinomadura sp.]